MVTCQKTGAFLFSLDFELIWGVYDIGKVEAYKKNIRAVRGIIPRILALFDRYEVHGTWAAVGMLMCQNKEELLHYAPSLKPDYTQKALSNYDRLKAPELDPQLHFAPDLIETIRKQPHQEIASHTFSHYYCKEPGQTPEAFVADVKACAHLFKDREITLKSLVFPRNQYSDAYVHNLASCGIAAYRGLEDKPIQRIRNATLRRYLLFLNSYINLAGDTTYALPQAPASGTALNLPSSHYLRACRPVAPLEKMKVRRIKRLMRKAAQGRRVFHLWSHPHDFATLPETSLAQLEEILGHYQTLRKQYGFQSKTMGELADESMPGGVV